MQTDERKIALLIAVPHHQGGVKCSTQSATEFVHRWGFQMLENETAIMTNFSRHIKADAALHFVRTGNPSKQSLRNVANQSLL